MACTFATMSDTTSAEGFEDSTGMTQDHNPDEPGDNQQDREAGELADPEEAPAEDDV